MMALVAVQSMVKLVRNFSWMILTYNFQTTVNDENFTLRHTKKGMLRFVLIPSMDY